MSPADEAELYRLTDMIAEVDRTIPDPSPLREAIQKAALALHIVFIQGSRLAVEERYAGIDAPLTEEQRANLRLRGIE